MKRDRSLTIERLKEVIDYDQINGTFVWKKDKANRKAGQKCGNSKGGKYWYIRIDKVDYLAQRLAWFWVYGTWPRLIRFQNGIITDCRIENLREGYYVETRYDHRTPEGRSSYQKEYRKDNPDKHRNIDLIKTFGITLEEYNKKLELQNGVCAICSQPEIIMRSKKLKSLAVDHDHKTGAIRDLLCQSCNIMIGVSRESTDILIKAIEYLNRYKTS